jgi:hypothetical protein
MTMISFRWRTIPLNNLIISKVTFLCEKHSINIDTYIRMSIHPYKYTHTYPTPMSTFKRLNQFDLKINEVDHQERITVDGDVTSH